MKKLLLHLDPEVAFDPDQLSEVIQKKIRDSTHQYIIRKRSIDARKKRIMVRLEVEVFPAGEIPSNPDLHSQFRSVINEEPVLIIGAGPAGLFAAMELIKQGCKPIILERGKDVQTRRRDLVAITRNHQVDPDSNYCFGEGGAGTYSDGKLYTRSKKRGDIQFILNTLVAHGAPEDILIDAHPHIGTNKLPKVIAEIRSTILQAGGEIHFQTRVVDFIIENNKITAVKDQSGAVHSGKSVILATGHSARDMFTLLHTKSIAIEVKPFALGVRVEHPQSLIDRIQYHGSSKGLLPAAAYSLNHQIKPSAKSVFSFCMCPGGFMVPAATQGGEIVVNGMSPSRRDSKYANSGIVVAVDQPDFKDHYKQGPLAGMFFQSQIEQLACQTAGGDQTAPAQRLMDFLNNQESRDLPECSYVPGVASVNLTNILPSQIDKGIKEAFRVFGKKMKGYLTNEAVVVGVESRTSSPVRIPRNSDDLQHPQISGLYPCGEGAGYAGGIMSAALDGLKCAQAIARKLKPTPV